MKTIKLDNRTHYFSKDLNKLFALVLKEYKRLNFDFKFKTVNVKCIYRKTKDGFCGGYAYYNNNFVCMKLSKERRGYGTDSFAQAIARTFHHELDHCKGLSHGNMKAEHHRDISYVAPDFLIREKKPAVKLKKTPDHKVTVLLERKKKWESKLKRCKNAITKIERQVKYYEKKKQTV